MTDIDKDYEFVSEHGPFCMDIGFVDRTERCLEIIEKYKDTDSDEGMYSYVTAYAYLSINLVSFVPEIIKKLEEYLSKKPYRYAIASTLIAKDIARPFDGKLPRTAAELCYAEKLHYHNVYCTLAKLYDIQGDEESAQKYIDLGFKLLPERKYDYAWTYFEVCAKTKRLDEFKEFLDELPAELVHIKKMFINRAKKAAEMGDSYKTPHFCPKRVTIY